MSEHHEDNLAVDPDTIKSNETAGDPPEDDEIAIFAKWASQRTALFTSDPVFDFAEPAHPSCKVGLRHGGSQPFSSILSLEESGNV